MQKNSSSGGSSWYSDWKWLKPYSSQITLDENRALLPPLPDRPAVYTYYDPGEKRSEHSMASDTDIKQAENALLLTWRRAWWAQGFKPIVLGPAEAMNNPRYEKLQRLDLEGGIKNEMLKWLAWESMGTGLLCNYMALPMAPYNDPLLSFLRRGTFPVLTRFEALGSGVFAGHQKIITEALTGALANPELGRLRDMISAVPATTFEVDPQHEAVAYYNQQTLNAKYPAVDKAFGTPESPTTAKGLHALNNLINAHLHDTWQNAHPSGIAVLKPGRIYMNALTEPAIQVAKFLSQCSDQNPVPGSCPPNVPNAKCKPCVASAPMKISTPQNYVNASDLYTIGIVPHPYTRATLAAGREDINVTWIRRESERDPWLSTITQIICGTGVSGPPRALAFKEAVASPWGVAQSLWLSAEKEIPDDLDWRFGFAIASNETDNGKSETPVPGPERRPTGEEVDFRDLPLPTESELEMQASLASKARDFLEDTREDEDRKESHANQEVEGSKKLRAAIEMWNLADTEAWKFARAFVARGRMERLKWEEEERRFAGSVAESQGGGRWFDRLI